MQAAGQVPGDRSLCPAVAGKAWAVFSLALYATNIAPGGDGQDEGTWRAGRLGVAVAAFPVSVQHPTLRSEFSRPGLMGRGVPLTFGKYPQCSKCAVATTNGKLAQW